MDPHEAPSMWWEADCVRYGLGDVFADLNNASFRISYTPVRSRLTAVMGSHVARLTDREYMTRLATKLQEDDEARQRARIERRRLKQTTIVPDLSALPESLLRQAPQLRRRRWPRVRCTPKIDAEAAKMCKQLPGLLLENDSQPEAKSADTE